jgi:hypothetical protein
MANKTFRSGLFRENCSQWLDEAQKLRQARLKIELTKGPQSIMKYKHPREIVLP